MQSKRRESRTRERREGRLTERRERDRARATCEQHFRHCTTVMIVGRGGGIIGRETIETRYVAEALEL